MVQEVRWEATVTTGLEASALSEIFDTFGSTISASAHRGHVFFNLPLSTVGVNQALGLRSVDNLFVVMYQHAGFKFPDNREDAFKTLRSVVRDVDWLVGLTTWEMIHGTLPGGLSNSLEIYRSYCTSPNIKLGTTACTSGLNNSDATGATLPSFRVSCNRAGVKEKHPFTSVEAAAVFGGEIQDCFQWNVSMKQFDVEIILNIAEDELRVSIAITHESLHRRNICKFGPTTLRSTICYGLLRMCKLQPGDIVCDPMCGTCSIPLEAVQCWPSCIFLAGDLCPLSVQRSYDNIHTLNVGAFGQGAFPVTVFHWDVTRLPLRDESVDCFVSDLPFGKRVGSRQNNLELYPQTLVELARVAKRGTGRAVLFTQDKRTMLRILLDLRYLWKHVESRVINVGGLYAVAFVLHRTDDRVQPNFVSNVSASKTL